MRATGAAGGAVVVALVFSSGWVWPPWAMTHKWAARQDKVRIERVEVVDAGAPSLYVPRIGTTIIWGLAFVRSENDAYAAFSPGFEPVYSTPDDPTAGDLRWESSSVAGSAILQFRQLGTNRTAPSAPSTGPAQDPLRLLIEQRSLWRA